MKLPPSDSIDTNKEYVVGVYGTLKKGHYNYKAYLDNHEPIGKSWVKGIMLHLGNFPMVVAQPLDFPLRTHAEVQVELYRVSGKTLEALDHLESHPRFYERRWIESHAHGGFWVYFGHTNEYWKGVRRVIFDGIWDGASTPTIDVDFKDGKCKPHYLPKVNNPTHAALVAALNRAYYPGTDTHAEAVIEAEVVKEEVLEPNEVLLPNTAEWDGLTTPKIDIA